MIISIAHAKCDGKENLVASVTLHMPSVMALTNKWGWLSNVLVH